MKSLNLNHPSILSFPISLKPILLTSILATAIQDTITRSKCQEVMKYPSECEVIM